MFVEQVFREARRGDRLHVTIVSNELSGEEIYAVAMLTFQPAAFVGGVLRSPRFATDPKAPADLFPIQRNLSPGFIPMNHSHPIVRETFDLSISNVGAVYIATFRRYGPSRGSFIVTMEAEQSFLTGRGPARGSASRYAMYVIGFGMLYRR